MFSCTVKVGVVIRWGRDGEGERGEAGRIREGLEKGWEGLKRAKKELERD